MNISTIIGRISREPDLRYLEGSGTAVCKFPVAVNRKFKKDETDFFECVAWRKTGELCGEYLHKGSLVALNGRMESRSYENKEGQKVKIWEFQVDEVQFLDSKGKSASPTPARDEWSDVGQEIGTDDPDSVPF
jgi:single-strand DNA-binding protein